LAYLAQPTEKANEDLALGYFRVLFGDAFTRQKEARRADGYVPGCLVLELKGEAKDWLSGLFQGLAYKNEALDFAQIVVAAKSFLAVWQVNDLPEQMRVEVSMAQGAPNVLGKKFAKKYSSHRNDLLKLASWNEADLFAPLFLAQSDLVLSKLHSFEKTLREGRRVRQRITVANFSTVLREMVTFFDPDQPIKTVRAFYSMLYAWTDHSAVQLSQKTQDQATLGGEIITNLIPGKRSRFKDFVEARYVAADTDNSYDEFFARYDEALDAVDKSFRRTHGIFFTDLDLSRFVMWLVRQYVPDLGQNYLVIDPACGSGNLVTNWRSPLELRHKVVSEIEPELLFAVEQRMRGDLWHNGKFTVVPKVSENRGLNFLDRSAPEYLSHLTAALAEKGHAPDKPIAFLCNPPYRSDDDQTASAISYKVHPSVVDITGTDAASERYCSFLGQMKLICESARSSGLPGDSLLLIFTKSAWLTKRSIFRQLRSQILSAFEDVAGVLVNGREFFDVKGSWPVAFMVWRYKGPDANLNPDRAVRLIDLTWLKREQLVEIAWSDPGETEAACRHLITNELSTVVELGVSRTGIREWSGKTMTDFKRARRKSEREQQIVGGLPLGDKRSANKKAYGQIDGTYIGFMDDLTPCRIKQSIPGKPWFRLNSQFMDAKKNRCFSGPPTHWGYCAEDLASARKLFFWYALARTFVQRPYPMWVDADDMWAPSIPRHVERRILATSFAIGFAENECVETYFPANNPVVGAREVFVQNPMTPLDSGSFWSAILRPYIDIEAPPQAMRLIESVTAMFDAWKALFRAQQQLPIAYHRAYSVDDRPLTRTAGIIQIKDYGTENSVKSLVSAFVDVQANLRVVKDEFFELMSAKDNVNYFGASQTTPDISIPEKTRFDRVLCKRLALAALLVMDLNDDPNFGRTKLAKLFYLADVREDLALETEYVKEAAGPLDQRSLYNPRIGVEALAQKYGLFQPVPSGKMIRYKPLDRLRNVNDFAAKHLGSKSRKITKMAVLFKGLTTDQSEIIATLFACWNDFLIQKHSPTDDEIITECVQHWHPKKARFSRARLGKALAWMREHDLVPSGRGKVTRDKPHV
jgi:hypothetical protein